MTNGNHTHASDYFIENGSYFRCNRITLGYSFNKNLLSKIHVESLRLYMGVKNPFTITGYSMFDPQVPNNGSTLNRGVDGAYYYSGKILTGQTVNFCRRTVDFLKTSFIKKIGLIMKRIKNI